MENISIQYGDIRFELSNIDAYIKEFMKIWNDRPVKDNHGGMLSTHQFWTWYCMKQLNPKYVIESGVFKGEGTWLLRQALPDAKIFSIDVDLTQREYVDEEVNYFSDDFSQIFWDDFLDTEETVCFFDDHQNAYNRLLQMKWGGVQESYV